MIAGLRLASIATLSKGTFTRKRLFALRYLIYTVQSKDFKTNLLKFVFLIKGIVHERCVRYAAFPHA